MLLRTCGLRPALSARDKAPVCRAQVLQVYLFRAKIFPLPFLQGRIQGCQDLVHSIHLREITLLAVYLFCKVLSIFPCYGL